MYLHHKIYGQPLSSGKPVIVMLHGFLGSQTDWQPLLGPYQQDFSFVLIDLPGHGKSDALPAGANAFAGWQRAFMRTLSDLTITKYWLCGYSLGGRLALSIAAQKSPQLQGLLLESCHFGLSSRSQRLNRLRWQQTWQQFWLQQSSRQMLGEWYKQSVFDDLSAKQRNQQINKRWRGINKWRTSQSLGQFSLQKQPDYWALLQRLTIPIHYLVGCNDKKYAKLATKLSHTGSSVTTHLIQGAGHNVHAYQPTQWQRCFELWWQQAKPK